MRIVVCLGMVLAGCSNQTSSAGDGASGDLSMMMMTGDLAGSGSDMSGAARDMSPMADMWLACNLHGTVGMVSNFGDYKIRVVNAFGDAKVQMVTSFPDNPGEWQFVDPTTGFPDFTVEEVTVGEDFTVEYVTSFPGCM